MTRLSGKSALITGAARGIGRGFANAYIAEGATVAIADLDMDAARGTAHDLGASAYAVQMDVSDQAG
jgi:NAD(P)-dependent dehydrogenase (short-subunit alcohol dehydrogenase family)